MIKQVILAIVVGIVTAIVVALIGVVLVEVGVEQIGNFVKGVAAVVGILAGIWYFFTNQTPTRAL
jgi:glutamate mutase epsilon subunit